MYKRINELLGTNYKSDEEINWVDISVNYNLNEDFIEEFSNYLHWEFISEYQVLSENFIRKYKDRLDWEKISTCQILSWSFILKNKDYVCWDYISLCQPFICSDYIKIDKNLLIDNFLYKLYQQTKERGWFIGYVREYYNEKTNDDYFWIYFTLFDNYFINLKVKVYWKDMLKISISKKIKLIREVKYV